MTRSLGAAAPRQERVFAYGTLLLPEIMRAVIGRGSSGLAATLPGYARFLMRGECFPAIVPDPGSETRGLLFDDINAEELARLDEYEGEFYARARVRVALDAGASADALAYVLLPEHRDQLTPHPWDCERFRAEEADAFLASLRADDSN